MGRLLIVSGHQSQAMDRRASFLCSFFDRIQSGFTNAFFAWITDISWFIYSRYNFQDAMNVEREDFSVSAMSVIAKGIPVQVLNVLHSFVFGFSIWLQRLGWDV